MSEETKRLINRIHSANSLAKACGGKNKARLYKIKKDGVVHFANKFPEWIHIDSVEETQDGEMYIVGITGIHLGRVHLVVPCVTELKRALFGPYANNL